MWRGRNPSCFGAMLLVLTCSFFSLATSFAESASTCNAVFAVASRPLRHHRSALRFAHAQRVERAGSLNAISRRKTCAIEASGPRVKTREKKDVACACTLAPPFFSLTSSSFSEERQLALARPRARSHAPILSSTLAHAPSSLSFSFTEKPEA